VESLDRLFELQTIDLELQVKQEQLKRLMTEHSDPVLEQAQTHLSDKEGELQLLRREMKDRELEIETYSEKIRKLTREMNAGKGGAKELMEKQSELDSLKHHKGELEDRLLEMMERMEVLLPEVSAIQHDVRQRQQDQSLQQDGRQQEIALLQEEIAKLQEQREPAAVRVPPEFLVQYEDARILLLGKLVALVRGDRCGGCGIQLASRILYVLRTEDPLLQCENCGRYLYKGLPVI
jgi:predicted  nucleic acid-binding Zn-ribbon protein